MSGLHERDAVARRSDQPGPVEVVPDKVYALPLVYELDGRESTHPTSARGFGSINCSLLREGNYGLLLDTGLPAHQEALFAQIDEVMGENPQLSVMVARTSELLSFGNLAALIERYPIQKVYAIFYTDLDFIMNDVRPRFARAAKGIAHIRPTVENIMANSRLSIDPQGARQVDVVRPVLRLLSQFWAYDETTRTLMAGEIFGYLWRQNPQGPWCVDETNDEEVSAEAVADFLAATRYWWLCGADTDGIRRSIIELFERLDVESIVSSVGCVLKGRATVEKHVEILVDAIALLSERSAESVVRLGEGR